MGSWLPSLCLLNISYLEIIEILIFIWNNDAFLGLVQSPLFFVATTSEGENSQHYYKGFLSRNSTFMTATKVSPIFVNISNVSTIQGNHPLLYIFTIH